MKYDNEFFINKYSILTEAEILNNLNTIEYNTMIKYRKFDEDFLKKIISECNMFTIMIYQKVSKKFIFDYILNPKYHDSDIDTTIDIHSVCKYQDYSIDELKEYEEEYKKLNI